MIDYETLGKEIGALIEGESNPVGQMANVAALLKERTGWFWIGFYTVKGDSLELGPFQGPTACYTIRKGKGVCGTAWERNETILVDNVEQFPGHIACSSLSRSEIVVPLRQGDSVKAVLDIDSTRLSEFTEADKIGLESLCRIMESHIAF